jgi:hypothetical protein
MNCDFDFKQKRVEITLRTPIEGDMFEQILAICNDGIEKLRLETLDDKLSKVLTSFEVEDIKINSHSVKFDYSKSNPIVHQLFGNFKSLKLN